MFSALRSTNRDRFLKNFLGVGTIPVVLPKEPDKKPDKQHLALPRNHARRRYACWIGRDRCRAEDRRPLTSAEIV